MFVAIDCVLGRFKILVHGDKLDIENQSKILARSDWLILVTCLKLTNERILFVDWLLVHVLSPWTSSVLYGH